MNLGRNASLTLTAHGTANTAADLVTSNKAVIAKEKHEAKLNFDVKHSQKGVA